MGPGTPAAVELALLRLQAAGRTRRANLALVFWYFLRGSIFVFRTNACFCCVRFFSTRQKIGWEERLRNDLFCVVWDLKPQLKVKAK